MSDIVKALNNALALGNMQKISQTMDQFEQTFVNMEVQSEFVEAAMAGSTSLSTPEDQVNSLMQQVADDYGLEVSVGLPKFQKIEGTHSNFKSSRVEDKISKAQGHSKEF